MMSKGKKFFQYAFLTIVSLLSVFPLYYMFCGATNNESITMPMLVANLLGGYSVDYGMLMLGVFICTVPTAIVFFCLQKSFAEGITGSVK